MTKTNETELAVLRNAICKEHAAQIIDFLETLTNGNLPECLGVAAQQYQDTHSELWLAVSQGIEALMRQDAHVIETRPSPSSGVDENLPF